jgi:hypothetical protein
MHPANCVLRGVAVGMPHVAGMRVGTMRLRSISSRRTSVTSRRPDRRYVVAATDLEFYDFVDTLSFLAAHRFEVPTIMPEVLEDYIAQRSPLGAPSADRIMASR